MPFSLIPPKERETHPLQSKICRIRLDAKVTENRKKWRRLEQVEESNSTAKKMANEAQHEFALLCVKDSPLVKKKWRNDRFLKKTLYLHAQMDKYQIASAFIKDGIHGRKIGYRLDRLALSLHEAFHSSAYRIAYTIIVCISCALAFFENPLTDRGHVEYTYFILDNFCLLLYGIDVYIRWYMSSNATKKRFLMRQPWAYVRSILLLITLADTTVYICFPSMNPSRYSRALRPFFLITRRRNIRIIFGSCLRAFKEVLIVMSLVFCLLAFFGLLGYLLFSDISDAVHAPYFNSLSDSMYTMVLIHHCLPYMVQSMYPYYVQTQWSAVFFIVFVLLTNLFFAKLSIAVSYRSYRQHTEKMLFKKLQKRRAALDSAFEILAEDAPLTETGSSKNVKIWSISVAENAPRQMSHESWIRVCKYLQPQWTASEASLIYNTVDPKQTGYVQIADFYELCSFMSVQIARKKEKLEMPQFVTQAQQSLRNALLYHFHIQGQYYIVISECIVGLLIAISIVQAVQVNNIQAAYSTNSGWRKLGEVLLWLFTMEIVLKLFAFGKKEFLQRPFCRLDLGIVLVGWLFYYITSLEAPPHISLIFYDLCLAIRSLRVLKLFNFLPSFREILEPLGHIIPLMLQLFLVIFSVTYAFAVFTQAFYGTFLQSDFPNELKMEAMAWFPVRLEFQVKTFEGTLVTLFGVATLAGWNMIMDAAHAVTQSRGTYIFFFSYRVAVSNILLPIVVGFLVESFTSHAKRKEAEGPSMAYIGAAPTIDKNTDDQWHLVKVDDAESKSLNRKVSQEEYEMKFERYGSFLQGQMFDTSKSAELSHLQAIVKRQKRQIDVHEQTIHALEKRLQNIPSTSYN